jgi:hypothetical protein
MRHAPVPHGSKNMFAGAFAVEYNLIKDYIF